MKDINCQEACNNNCTCEETNECTCNPCECEDCDCKETKKEKKHKKDDKINKKIEELEDNLLRSKAEFVNYRKRLEDEQLRILKYCNEDLIKELLPSLDNFERAINMDDVNLSDEVSKFLSGFKMIYCSLLNTLKENGLVEIDGFNKPFDPTYHEAIMVEKRENTDSGMVLDVMQKGYILKGKVIRPAMVRVSE